MTANREKSGPIGRDLAKSLRVVQLGERDAGAVALARRLAFLLDEVRGTPREAAVFNDLAPKYLAVLTALGLTPAGRGAKGGAHGPTGGKLDDLRARRARKHGATAVDTTPP